MRQQVDPEWYPPGGPWSKTRLPDWVLYTFLDSGGTSLGYVLAVQNASPVNASSTGGPETSTYEAQSEYWAIDPSTIANATSLTATPGAWSGGALPSFPSLPRGVTEQYRLDTSATWSAIPAAPTDTLLFGGACPAGSETPTTVFGFHVEVSPDKPLRWHWFQGYARAAVPGFAMGGPTSLQNTTWTDISARWSTIDTWRDMKAKPLSSSPL
ncbi:MAG: hypothetical protein U0441_17260 [Polyangiaceae bacterium]